MTVLNGGFYTTQFMQVGKIIRLTGSGTGKVTFIGNDGMPTDNVLYNGAGAIIGPFSYSRRLRIDAFTGSFDYDIDTPTIDDIRGSGFTTGLTLPSPVRNVALLGHSFTVQAYASITSDAPRGLAYWAGLLSGQRLRFDYGRVFGVPGDTTSPFNGRAGFTSRLAAALASDADIIVVSDPTNNFAAGVPHETTVADMVSMFSAIRAANKVPVTWAPTPRGGANVLSADGLLLQARYANWLKSNARAIGVFVAEASITLSDPNVAGFDFAAGMAVSDTLHLAIPGGRALGQAIVDALSFIMPPFDVLGYSGADAYDAVKNPNGNLLNNPLMRGTGGTTSAGGSTISGQVADGWQVLVANGAGLTVNCSLVTVKGRRMQQVAVNGTPTAGNPAVWVRQTPAFSGQIAQGDNLQSLGYCELDAGSSGITGFGIEQWTGDAGGNHAMRTGNSVGSLTNGTFPADAVSGVQRTMLNLTGANPTTFYAQHGIQGVNGTAMNATVRWSNLEIRKAG